MGVVADDQVFADRNSGGTQPVHFFEQARRINDNTVADNRVQPGLNNAGGQQGEFISSAGTDYSMTRIGAAVVPNDEIMLFREQIDDFTFGLVAPLQADDTGAGHSTYLARRAGWRARKARRGAAHRFSLIERI